MKKIIIVCVVFLAGISFVFGAEIKRQWANSKTLPAGFTQEIRSDLLDYHGIKVLKFQDDKTVCYIAHTNISGTPVSTNEIVMTTSMECNF